MVVILTKDLMMGSTAGSVARSTDISLKSISSVDKAIEAMSTDEVELLLVDLQMPGLQIEAIENGLNSLPVEKRPHSIAYAQHVNVELISQARDSCFDEVLTRGQLNSGLGEIISRWKKN